MGDPFSIISGVLGSYTACCEIFRQIQSIRRFHRDSEVQVDLLELQAYRVVLWGEGHKIRQQRDAPDASQTLVFKEQEKYLNKLLNLFEDVRLFFDKYGIQYDKSSSSVEQDKFKTILKKSVVPIRRLQWGINAKDELRLKSEDIRSYVDSLHDVWPVPGVVQTTIDTDISKKLQNSLEEILGSPRPQQLKQLEFWLSLDSLRLVPRQDLETYFKRLTPNSGQWIEENTRYKAWRDQHRQERTTSILWIDGPPGSGKSVLCASLIKKLRSEASLLAFFFSTKHAQTGGDINFIIRFWLQQLAEENATIRQYMVDLCSKENASTRITNDDTWKLFRDILETQNDLIFVIDGIDEYYRHGQERNDDGYRRESEPFISTLIRSCVDYKCSIRLLIVSRPIGTLSSALYNTSIVESSKIFRHSISASDVAQDIQLLATDFVKGTFTSFKVPDQEKLISDMVRLSKGSFLWIDSVKKRLKPNLKLGLLLKEMNNVPSDLQEKYNKDLAKLAKIKPHKTLIILSWILLAKQPVTVWEMCQVLAVQTEDCQPVIEPDLFPEYLDDEWIYDNISRFCGDEVITQDNRTAERDSWLGWTTLSPLHPSVSDHILPLLTPEKTTDHQQQLFPDLAVKSSAHLQVANLCFAWLINDNFESELTVERPSSSAPRLKDYALKFWHVHLEEAPDRDDFTLDLLLDFFRKDNDHFIEWATYYENSLPRKSAVSVASPLYYAVSLCLNKVVEAILQDDPSQINLLGGSHGSALMASLVHKRLACFQELLRNGADPNLQTKSGSVFLMAVKLRAIPFLELLLEYNANSKIEDEQKANAFHILASNKHENDNEDRIIFKMLQKQDLDLNAKNDKGSTPLILASERGYTELVKIILSCKNVDLNVINDKKRTAIYEAARTNAPAVFEMLFKAGAEYVARLYDGFTPFCVACSNGNIQAVRLLMPKAIADGFINTATDFDWTPTWIAAYQGHANVVKLLIDNHAEHTKRHGAGFTPLHIACMNGLVDTVLALLKSSAVNINEKTSNTLAIKVDPHTKHRKSLDEGSTALILALTRKHENVAKKLLDVKAIDVLVTNANGLTALHYAADGGLTDTVKTLVSRMRPEDFPRRNKKNPLYFAIRKGRIDVVRLLLENDFDVKISPINKKRAIERLAQKGSNDILEVLIKRWEKTSGSLWDEEFISKLLWWACTSSHYNTLSFLLRTFEDKLLENKPDEKNWTPLGYAAKCKEEQVGINLLLQFQSRSKITNIDHYNGEESTALLLAASRGHDEFIAQLLVHGADPTLLHSDNKETSLHKAIQSKHLKTVEVLLNHLRKIDRLDILNLVDSYGYTPVHEAVYDNVPAILELLLEWKADATCNTKYGTPIYQAARNGYQQALTILLTHLKDTNNIGHIDEESKIRDQIVTPLYGAVYEGNFEITRDLIEHGANILNSRHGSTSAPVIHYAVRRGHWRIVELLCANDPGVLELTDADGRTPLMEARHEGNLRMVRLLLDQPRQTAHIVDANGRNALHHAAHKGWSKFVKLLLQHDPSMLNATDLHGATALSIAARLKQKEVAELLMGMPDIDIDLKDTFGKDVIDWMIIAGIASANYSTDKREHLALALSKLSQSRLSLTAAYCDVCSLEFVKGNPRWSCRICKGDNFDICQRCLDWGAYCFNREHELEEKGKTAVPKKTKAESGSDFDFSTESSDATSESD